MTTRDNQFPATITIWRKGDDLLTRRASLQTVTLPDGTERKLLRDGAVGCFVNKTTGNQTLKLRFRGRWHVVPTMEQVAWWTFDSVCETPDGRTVEPDASDSWLSLLGLV